MDEIPLKHGAELLLCVLTGLLSVTAISGNTIVLIVLDSNERRTKRKVPIVATKITDRKYSPRTL